MLSPQREAVNPFAYWRRKCLAKGQHLLIGDAGYGKRCPSCARKIEDEAARMAVAAEMGVSEWEAFTKLAEEKLIEEGALVHAD